MSLAALPTSSIVKTLEQNGLSFKNLPKKQKMCGFILHGQGFIQDFSLGWGNVDACKGCMCVLVHLPGFIEILKSKKCQIQL